MTVCCPDSVRISEKDVCCLYVRPDKDVTELTGRSLSLSAEVCRSCWNWILRSEIAFWWRLNSTKWKSIQIFRMFDTGRTIGILHSSSMRSPQDVDVLLLEFQIPCSRPETLGFCLLTKHRTARRTSTRSTVLRVLLRNLDQDDLDKPTNKSQTDLKIVCTSLFPVLVKTFKLIHF